MATKSNMVVNEMYFFGQIIESTKSNHQTYVDGSLISEKTTPIQPETTRPHVKKEAQ